MTEQDKCICGHNKKFHNAHGCTHCLCQFFQVINTAQQDKLPLVIGFGKYAGDANCADDDILPESQKIADEIATRNLKDVDIVSRDSDGKQILSRHTISLLLRDFKHTTRIEAMSKLAQREADLAVYTHDTDALKARIAELEKQNKELDARNLSLAESLEAFETGEAWIALKEKVKELEQQPSKEEIAGNIANEYCDNFCVAGHCQVKEDGSCKVKKDFTEVVFQQLYRKEK